MTETYDGVVTSELNETEEDKKLLVQFYSTAVQNNFKSAEAGRPIFDDVDMIKIIVPGSRDVLVSQASEIYQRRFPRHWEAYMSKKEMPTDGTPLTEVPFLSAAQVGELIGINIKTLEHLAEMPDVAVSRMMGANTLRETARKYLAAAEDNAAITKMQSLLESRDNDIEVLKRQIEELKKSLAASME